MLTSFFTDIPLDALAARMFTTAFVVIAITWAVGVFGPLVGGALAGLPIVLGPGFYFLAAQEPALFVSHAAAYALLSLCATQLFLLAYIFTAHRSRPLASLGLAVFAWSVAAYLFQFVPAQPVMGIVLFVLTTMLCLRLGARLLSRTPPSKGKAGFGLLLARGILAGALVAAVTTASHNLGSTAAGLLMAFPVGYSMMAVTIHQKFGAANVIATLHSALLGTASLAGFCTALALAAPHWTPHAALAGALAASVVITLSLVVKQRAVKRAMAKAYTMTE